MNDIGSRSAWVGLQKSKEGAASSLPTRIHPATKLDDVMSSVLHPVWWSTSILRVVVPDAVVVVSTPGSW